MEGTKTVPIFIVGSGRNGTRSLGLMLAGVSHIESYHEYLCTHIQPVAAKYFMRLINKKTCKEKIMKLHGSAIYYSSARKWMDSSNKLSWIIEPLYELFPYAKFVHVVRDGRKVVSSFFHKLAPEIYDDVSTSALTKWLKNPQNQPEPPPEKKYWWNIPQKGQPYHKEFPYFNQFQRICYHWAEAIRVVQESFYRIPNEQKLEVSLEDLVSNKDALKTFLNFFDIEYEDHFYEYLQKPRNVFFPMDFDLTKKELDQFYEIAGKTLKRLGYADKKAYSMKY